MDDELFMEDKDKIKQTSKIISKPKQIDDISAEEEIAKMARTYVDAFRGQGFNKKDSVFITSQILLGYTSGVAGKLVCG